MKRTTSYGLEWVRHAQDSFCLDSMSFDINAKLLHDIQKEIRELLTKNIATKSAALEGDAFTVERFGASQAVEMKEQVGWIGHSKV